jgi:hypothetical protein
MYFRNALVQSLKQPMRGGPILGYRGANAQRIHDGICKLRLSVSSHWLNRLARSIHELCSIPSTSQSRRERSGVYPVHSPCFSV